MISSPRILRPFTVTLIHKVDEDTFIPYVLENVGFDENYGITQSNKGISDADSVLLTIDLSDCVASLLFILSELCSRRITSNLETWFVNIIPQL